MSASDFALLRPHLEANCDGSFQGNGTTQSTDRYGLFHGDWHRIGCRYPTGRDESRSWPHWPRGNERDSRGAGWRSITEFHLHASRRGRAADTAKELRKAMDASESIRGLLLKFVQVFMVQTAHTAIANARAHIDQRLRDGF